MPHGNLPVPEDQFRVLRTLYEWRYVGREMVITFDDGETLYQNKTEPSVPDYLIRAELRGSRIDVDAAIRALRDRKLIEDTETRADVAGTWRLPDGRSLDVAYDQKPLVKGREFHIVNTVDVRLDGTSVAGSQTLDSPCGTCFKPTEKGIRIAELDPRYPGREKAKRRGRRRRKPDKLDQAIDTMEARGDLGRYQGQWQELCRRYQDVLPRDVTPDRLRMRVKRRGEHD